MVDLFKRKREKSVLKKEKRNTDNRFFKILYKPAIQDPMMYENYGHKIPKKYLDSMATNKRRKRI